MDSRASHRLALTAAILSFGVALVFALYTNHVWEDYYITYRASRNLAQGNGLVFNVGDRLHTFTSPLGTLLPALASYVTGTNSDAAALWLFRVMAAAALGGAAWLLVRAMARSALPWLAVVLPVAWLATDAKTLDFTINGMETPFMLLFLAYTFWAHLHAGPRRWLHLGLAWAGLMWSRPDSFIYVGLIAAGCWIFHDASVTGCTRRELLRDFFRAGAVTTALYLPWLIVSWAYYGTPIPHTITAKGTLGAASHTWAEFLRVLTQLPYLAWTRMTSLEATFLPSYYMIGGWPAVPVAIARALATVASVLWLVPRLPAFARAASFAFFGVHVYLTFFPYFPFPWYIPNTAVLAALALAGALGALARTHLAALRGIAIACAATLVATGGWFTWEVGRQVRVQQNLVENEGRRRIGEWLHAHAAAGDTVFLEPLGYIGYFSNLKTYDFPGMSSREMVDVRRVSGSDWAQLIQWLQPQWLVLRPSEQDRINRRMPRLLREDYVRVQDFDVLDQVRQHAIHGRGYLEHDARFTVFKLNRPFRFTLDDLDIRAMVAPHHNTVGGVPTIFAHAPAQIALKIPPQARTVRFQFGFADGAWRGEFPTDGAGFYVEIGDRFDRKPLFDRVLQPTTQPAERTLQSAEVTLPADRSPDAMLLIRIDSRQQTNCDWTSITRPEFH